MLIVNTITHAHLVKYYHDEIKSFLLFLSLLCEHYEELNYRLFPKDDLLILEEHLLNAFAYERVLRFKSEEREFAINSVLVNDLSKKEIDNTIVQKLRDELDEIQSPGIQNTIQATSA